MPDNDMLSATTSAATNKEMRFLIFSPPLPRSETLQKRTTDHPLWWGNRLRHWLCPSLSLAPIFLGGGLQSLYPDVQRDEPSKRR